MDEGSTNEILYYDALFKRMSLNEVRLTPIDAPLIRFNGGSIYPQTSISLMFQVGARDKVACCTVTFLVADVSLTYNAIMGICTLNTSKVIPSTYHQMFKFLTHTGMEVVVYGSHDSAKCCSLATVKGAKARLAMQVEPDLRRFDSTARWPT